MSRQHYFSVKVLLLSCCKTITAKIHELKHLYLNWSFLLASTIYLCLHSLFIASFCYKRKAKGIISSLKKIRLLKRTKRFSKNLGMKKLFSSSIERCWYYITILNYRDKCFLIFMKFCIHLLLLDCNLNR